MRHVVITSFVLMLLLGFSMAPLVTAQTTTSAALDTSTLIQQLQNLINALRVQIEELRAKLETTQRELETASPLLHNSFH